SVIAERAGGAIFEVSGGDPDSWPRPENRPLYFWFGLDSGRIIQLPIGWDLLYFSADQTRAVFWKLQGERAPLGAPQVAGRAVAAVRMATGDVTGDVPDRNVEFWIPFDWQDKNEVKPLHGRRDSFAGLSVNGTPYVFDT